ncbi:MAG TPA: DUF3276 family protein [Segetibacter sp.]
MAYENNDQKIESVYSKRIRAGKRRTYFFDVRATRSNDYFLTITESRKRFNDNGYDRHKIFLYKEDFNKFIKALTEAVDYVKTDLMPDFDFDAFNHDNYEENGSGNGVAHNRDGVAASAESTLPVAEVTEGNEVPEVAETLDAAPVAQVEPEPEAATVDNHSTEEVDKW